MPFFAYIDGEPINALGYVGKLDEWKALQQTKPKIILPCCHSPGLMRRSSKGLPHFYHKPPVSEECNHTGESQEHEDLKYLIYTECKRIGFHTVEIEKYFREIRADVYCKPYANSQPITIEIQLSPITYEELLRREILYKNRGLRCIWLFKKTPRIPAPQCRLTQQVQSKQLKLYVEAGICAFLIDDESNVYINQKTVIPPLDFLLQVFDESIFSYLIFVYEMIMDEFLKEQIPLFIKSEHKRILREFEKQAELKLTKLQNYYDTVIMGLEHKVKQQYQPRISELEEQFQEGIHHTCVKMMCKHRIPDFDKGRNICNYTNCTLRISVRDSDMINRSYQRKNSLENTPNPKPNPDRNKGTIPITEWVSSERLKKSRK